MTATDPKRTFANIMAEKIEALEIYPMRGHSRGEWYSTLEDIANCESDAEYWAVFSVTPRGNRHCLAEVQTKSEALHIKRLFERDNTSAPKIDTSSHEYINSLIASGPYASYIKR